MLSLKNPYRNFLREVKKDLINQMRGQSRKATGLLEQSLRVVANQNFEGELRGLFYMEYLQDGVGSKPEGISRGLVNKIEIWMRAKGIPPREKGRFVKRTATNYRKSAFAIAKTISESGTRIYRGQRGINIQDAITRNIDELGQSVAGEYLTTFDEQLRIRRK